MDSSPMIMNTFKVGDWVRIKTSIEPKSSTARRHEGKCFQIMNIDVTIGISYTITNFPECGGVWHHELEHWVNFEDEMEDV